jgi:alpha-L-fucosidase
MATQLDLGTSRMTFSYDPRCRRPAQSAVTAVVGLLTLVSPRVASAITYSITVDASKQTTGNPRFWSASVGTGTASLTLRSDLQTHYKIANRELGMMRVRGHGVLNDDMGIYKGPGSYDWTKFDTYLTAIVSAGMRPLVELDFMPTALAIGGDYHSPPKDYNAYKDFIKAIVQHCVDKYGADDVGKWYWEVWNEPDYPGFWNGMDANEATAQKMSDYYVLYDAAVDAATSVIPNILIGGPGSTYYGPIGDFLKHCKSANKRVTFVSSHCYPGGDGSSPVSAQSCVDDNSGRVSQITGAGYTTAAVKSFNTEWNSSYSGQGGGTTDGLVSMDSHVNAPFILKTVKLLSDKNNGDTPPVEVFSYWVVSDVFGEKGKDADSWIMQQGGTLPFGSVFGLMTFQGIRKAAFNGFKMLNYLGPKRLQSAGGVGGDGVDAMATKSAGDDEVQILVYNYYATVKTTGSDNVTVTVNNLPAALAGKEIFVTQFLVDETHSNPYKIWVDQTKPKAPSEDQLQKLRLAQHLALAQPVSKKTVETSFSTSFAISKQAATLIILGTKRPLTGRDALVEIEGEDYDGQAGTTKEDSGDSTLGQSISLSSGGTVFFENVDYTDDGVASVQLRVKTQSDTTLELHGDSQTGTLLGKCAITSTSNAWATQTCPLAQPVTGVARLYVVAGGAVHLNWFKFQSAGSTGTGGAGGNTGSGGASGTGASAGTTASVTGGAAGSGTSVGGATSETAGASGGASGNASGGASASVTGGATGSGIPSGGAISGTAGASGGSTESAGGNGDTGSATVPTVGKSSGCGCHLGSAGNSPGALLILGLAAVLFGLRRQRVGRGPAGRALASRWILAALMVLAISVLSASCGSTKKATNDPNGGNPMGGSPAGGSQSCSTPTGGPASLAPLPSAAQRAYQRTELTAFIHFGMATFDGTEQGNLSVDLPSLFNPTNLDATAAAQWASALKAAGIGQAMLVTKHSTGFCLWPTATTDFSVKSSPWMGGQGDVVKLFTDAMHAAGIKVALYLSPWDQTYPSSKPDYETYFKTQLTELLTNYGTVYELEFDGFNAPTSNVDWKSVFALAKQLQPDILVWSGPEIVKTGAIPDLQWIGNENGKASRTTSSLDTGNCGNGSNWCPYECNTSSRAPNWFWHPNQRPMSLSSMQSVYFNTVGMNCTLNFNVPPTTTGQFDAADIDLLQQFGTWYSALNKNNLLQGQPAKADSTWASAGFDAGKAVDGEICTYWGAASGTTSARLEVAPASPITFNVISIREPIEMGERVKRYHVEIKQNGVWNATPLNTSGSKIQGTVIGQRQLWQLNPTTAEAIALVIDSAKDVPAIAEFSVMSGPGVNTPDAGAIIGNDGTLCPLPATAPITDFTFAPSDSGATDTTGVRFGSYGSLSGGVYIYPSSKITSDVTQSNWHITGTVGDYSGFGLYFDGCNRVDASKYKGISFKISGSMGTNPLTLGVATLNDSIAAGWINTNGGDSTAPGRCIPTSGTSQYSQQGCSTPSKTIAVTLEPTVVNVLWSDFSGGSPEASVLTPAEITSIAWTLPWSYAGTPYPVDLVIDDLSFIP